MTTTRIKVNVTDRLLGVSCLHERKKMSVHVTNFETRLIIVLTKYGKIKRKTQTGEELSNCIAKTNNEYF